MLSCDQILNKSSKEVLKCEALLLKSYSLMVNRKYKEAVALLRPAYDMISKFNKPTSTERDSSTNQYHEDRSKYFEVASTMNTIGYSGQTTTMLKKIDSTHVSQMDYEQKIKGYHKYLDEFSRRLFFAKPADRLHEDIEYALAKAEKMAGMGRTYKIQETVGKEINKIDDEMEKLKKELEKLEK